MNIKWNEVTWYSRVLSIIFFLLVLPMWAFYLGLRYEEAKQAYKKIPVVTAAPHNATGDVPSVVEE